MGGIAGEQVRRYVFPRRVLHVAGSVGHMDGFRHKRLKKPASIGIGVLLELSSCEAQLLAQLDAEADAKLGLAPSDIRF